MTLEKVKEALNEAIDMWAADPEAGNLELKVYKEALVELNTFIERLESEDIIEELAIDMWRIESKLQENEALYSWWANDSTERKKDKYRGLAKTSIKTIKDMI